MSLWDSFTSASLLLRTWLALGHLRQLWQKLSGLDGGRSTPAYTPPATLTSPPFLLTDSHDRFLNRRRTPLPTFRFFSEEWKSRGLWPGLGVSSRFVGLHQVQVATLVLVKR